MSFKLKRSNGESIIIEDPETEISFGIWVQNEEEERAFINSSKLKRIAFDE